MHAFLFVQGLETLPLRMPAHVENARAIAEFLQVREEVAWVAYAGLAGDPSAALGAKYLPDGAGSVFSFGLRGGRQAGSTFIESLELWSHLANVGDAKSLVIHPASTTHAQLSDAELAASGVTPELIRVSVGLEDPADLIWDLDRALRRAASVAAVGA
jgi:O-acetylhomoserine (thiol)-lyase